MWAQKVLVLFNTKVFIILCCLSSISPLDNNYDCGQVIMWNKGVLKSPNFPRNYPPNTECIWHLVVNETYQVALFFNSLKLESGCCHCDYVEIFEGDSIRSPLLEKLCVNRAPPPIFASQNILTVKFKSDKSIGSSGFSATFKEAKILCYRTDPNCGCGDSDDRYICDCRVGFEAVKMRCEVVAPEVLKFVTAVSVEDDISAQSSKNNNIFGSSFGSGDYEITAVETSTYVSLDSGLRNSDLSQALNSSRRWILNQRRVEGGWGKNTPRAIVALYLSDPTIFRNEDCNLKFMSKELELQLAFNLIRNETDKLNLVQLALYLNAFLATCHNPENIHGLNLVQELRLMTDYALMINDYVHPSVLLSLCLAEASSQKDIPKLKSLLEDSLKPLSAGSEAIAVMALNCISKNPQFSGPYFNLDELINSSLSKLVSSISKDRLSTNFMSAALVTQALKDNLRSDQYDRTSILKHFLKHQESDGSFGSLLETFYAVPVLAERSLLDLSLVHCGDIFKGLREFSPLSAMQRNARRSITVKYSLWHEKPQELSVSTELKVTAGTNFMEVMRLAAAHDHIFRFQTEELPTGVSVYSIGGVPNDAEIGLQWNLYVMKNASEPVGILTPSLLMPYVGDVRSLMPRNGDQVVFWYRH